MSARSQQQKANEFKLLHESESIFVMPNAWNAGSAVLLEMAGFAALGTTSAGIAYSHAVPDYQGDLPRDVALAETTAMAAAIKIPLSADAENGYGHEPELVAETIRLVAASGAVGANIEDYSSDRSLGMYAREHALERIKAARSAADALDFEFTLTARCECYLVNHDDAFNESVTRANMFREAGADCLFVPGVKDIDTIAALVREIDGPLNVVMGLVGKPISVAELEDVGVRRISIGGSLARATFGMVRRAAEEIKQHGTFNYAAEQIADSEMSRLFRERL